MLEKDCIQTRGFKNIKEDGTITGFQIKIRSLYYRGLWLSQIRPATLIVDGVTYSGTQIKWCINEKIYTEQEMESIGDVHWGVLDTATLLVDQLKGLESGYHDVELTFGFSSSYMPPEMDQVLSLGEHKKRMILV
jgi:hypothetical protein